jgi:hypothetical protein
MVAYGLIRSSSERRILTRVISVADKAMHRRSAEAKNAGGAIEEDVFPEKQTK